MADFALGDIAKIVRRFKLRRPTRRRSNSAIETGTRAPGPWCAIHIAVSSTLYATGLCTRVLSHPFFNKPACEDDTAVVMDGVHPVLYPIEFQHLMLFFENNLIFVEGLFNRHLQLCGGCFIAIAKCP